MSDMLPTTMRLQTETLNRSLEHTRMLGALAMSPPDMGRFAEMFELASASAKRMQAMQAGWVEAWMDWSDYATTLEGADTVPKYVDRLSNIMLRAQTQMATQASDMSNLVENVSVSYGYWLSQQLEGDD